MKLTEIQLDSLLFWAFRYALGRATYVVDDVASIIEQNKDSIKDADKKLYIQEISQAIEEGRAGMDMDVKRWEKVREALND